MQKNKVVKNQYNQIDLLKSLNNGKEEKKILHSKQAFKSDSGKCLQPEKTNRNSG
jgi:hypothetical protein